MEYNKNQRLDICQETVKQDYPQISWVSKINRYSIAIIIGFSALVPAYATGLGNLFAGNTESAQSSFLKVEQAFNVSGSQQGDQLNVVFKITPGHYVYKDKISVKLPNGVTASNFSFSAPAHFIEDPTFGRVAVFDQNQVTGTVTLNNSKTEAVQQNVTLNWQGCAKAGLCYPPQKQTISINLPSNKPQTNHTLTATKPLANTAVKQETKKQPEKVETSSAVVKTNNVASSVATLVAEKNVDDSIKVDGSIKSEPSSDNAAQVEDAQLAGDEQQKGDISIDDNSMDDNSTVNVQSSVITSDITQSDNSGLNLGNAVNTDPFGLAKHPWLALLLLFLAGFGLAFTPCVLPMLPIVSNIIARQHNPTAKKGLLLSGGYALGVSIAYGILGLVIAIFGESLGIIGWLQNPVILISFAVVFVLLALYMLGLFTIPIPNSVRQKMQSVSQAGDNYLGSTFGSFIAGFLSALVVSPCVSAPLLGALLAVSTIGNPFLGFAALFMLGFGLSAPLILLGMGQGRFMPKAGAWMDWVKQGFALLLLAVSLLLIVRVFINSAILVLWSIWFMVVALWLWSWAGRGTMLSKSLALLFAIWSAITMVGAAAGSKDSLQPLAVFTQFSSSNVVTKGANTEAMPAVSNHSDIHITKIDDLVAIVEQNDKVLVDVTADWCVECRIMDRTLFSNRPASLNQWQVVKLDVTKTNADSERVLSELKLFGPPALLYFVDGELKQQQAGEVKRADFEQVLNTL